MAEPTKIEERTWDGEERFPIRTWGKDHWSTLLYVETTIVEGRDKEKFGKQDMNRMRHKPGIPRRGWDIAKCGPPPSFGGDPRGYPTVMLADNEERSIVKLFGHDDWDCVDDMVEGGLIEWHGTGFHPLLKLTDFGWACAAALRKEGGNYRVFVIPDRESIVAPDPSKTSVGTVPAASGCRANEEQVVLNYIAEANYFPKLDMIHARLQREHLQRPQEIRKLRIEDVQSMMQRLKKAKKVRYRSIREHNVGIPGWDLVEIVS